MGSNLSMNQVIHAAVRRDVARTERALRALPDGDRARAAQIRRAWTHLVQQLKHHHESEDALVWPYLQRQGVDRALLDAMAAEHEAMAEGLRATTGAIDAVAADPSTTNATVAAESVAATSGVIDRHLDHEEGEAEPLIQEREDDPAWKAIEKQLRPRSLVDAGKSLAWMQDGAGQAELAALRATIPAPALFVVGRVLGRGYHREIAPVWRG